jgi:zona occludens toxin
MSILAYVGLPGSGKSYGVVENQILPALKLGRVVVTNIPLYEDRIREMIPTGELREFPTDLVAQQPELIDDYAPPGCVLIIDELWKLFPAGQKVNHVPEPFKKLLAEHRHMVDAEGRSTQIVFVTQDLAQIGAFARQLVEQTMLHTKLGHLGASGSFRCRIFHGQVTGQNPPKSSEIRMTLGRYDEKVYRLYKSHTMSKAASDGADEKAVDRRANVWKRPGILIAAGLCIVAVAWAVSALGAIFGGEDERPGASVATTRPAAPTVRGMRVPEKHYRVSMILDSSDAQLAYALLVDDAGAQIWVPREQCIRDRMQWRCRYEKKWWTLAGIYRPPQEDRRPLVPLLDGGPGAEAPGAATRM